MPSNVRRTLDKMRQSRESYINNEAFARNLNRSLSFDPINTLYVRGTSEYENKFIDQTARNDDSIIPKLIYGEVWLDSQVINRGIKRSTADPSQLVDEFEIVNGIGQNEGLKNDTGDSEDGLNNLVINGLAAVLGGIAAYQIADFIYKRSNDSGNSIWDDVTDVVGQEVFGDTDPNTGENIEQETNEIQPQLEQLANVESTPASKDDIIIFGGTGDQCGWVHKNFNQALIDSELDVLGLDIQDSGTLSDSDIHTINFASNLAVTVDGNGKITVDASGGSGTSLTAEDDGTQIATGVSTINWGNNLNVTDNGSGKITIDGTGEANTGNNVGSGARVFRDKTGVTLNLRSIVAGNNVSVAESTDEITISASSTTSPGGSTGTPSAPSSGGACAQMFVCEAIPGAEYALTRNGAVLSSYTAQQNDTVEIIGQQLSIVTSTIEYSVQFQGGSDQDYAIIVISTGYDQCYQSCPTGPWEITRNGSPIKSAGPASCGPVLPCD